MNDAAGGGEYNPIVIGSKMDCVIPEGLDSILAVQIEIFAQFENRIAEARIGDFSGYPAPAA